ncbi:signal peptidase I [methanogenic archaeon mixed culture ISO4-G1]|nr:signal peptidase I [methanogenic archaeon mixed culture ISO4-G1]
MDAMDKSPQKRKTKRVVAAVIIVAVVALAVYTFYDFNGHSLDPSDRQVLLIVTDSMDGNVTEYEIDSFPKNTLIMVKHLSAEEIGEIKIGDVLSFKMADGKLNHHRVIGFHLDDPSGAWIETTGDNPSYYSTDHVNLNDINGKVIGTMQWIGHLVTFVKQNFLLVIALLAGVAIAGEIYRYVKTGKELKE